MIANYLRLDDPALAPDAAVRRAARSAEATVADLVARGPAARPRSAARLVGFALRRARQLVGLRETAEVPAGAGPRPVRGAARGRRGAGAARAGSTRRTTSSSSTSPRSRRGLAGESTAARLVAERRAAYDAGAAPPAHPAAAALRRHRAGGGCWSRRGPEGALVGSPASAGHGDRHRPGRARPRRRPPRAGRDPGRAVDRSRLDAAVPDRRWSGHGDGRRRTPTAPSWRASTASRRWSAYRTRRTRSPPASGSPSTALPAW